jgi:outer membrane lipoprotein
MSRRTIAMCAALLAVTPACGGPSTFPPAIESQIDRGVSFAELKQSPEAYRGRMVLLGGEVLNARRLKDATRIEVLELPLSGGQDPVPDRTASQGRFLAFHKEFLDPATLPAGTRITIVGEVTGTATQPLDDTEYAYPTIDVKSLHVWPAYESYRRGYYGGPPYYRPGWGYGGYGPWRSPFYPYSPYWW